MLNGLCEQVGTAPLDELTREELTRFWWETASRLPGAKHKPKSAGSNQPTWDPGGPLEAMPEEGLRSVFEKEQPSQRALDALVLLTERIRIADPDGAVDAWARALRVPSLEFRMRAAEHIVQEPPSPRLREVLLEQGGHWLELERTSQAWSFFPGRSWLPFRAQVEAMNVCPGRLESPTKIDDPHLVLIYEATRQIQADFAAGLADYADDATRAFLKASLEVEPDDEHNAVYVDALLRHLDPDSLAIVMEHFLAVQAAARDLKRPASKERREREKEDRARSKAGQPPVRRDGRFAFQHVKRPIETRTRYIAHLEAMAVRLGRFAEDQGLRSAPRIATSPNWRGWGTKAVAELAER